MGAGVWGMESEEVCGEAVVSVKFDLAALLCLSGRFGMGLGEGKPREEEKKELRGVIPQPVYKTQIST